MTKDRANNILARLRVFEKLERKATDEIGWIALAFGVERPEAERMIREAIRLNRESSRGDG